jgi:hypothetical protein
VSLETILLSLVLAGVIFLILLSLGLGRAAKEGDEIEELRRRRGLDIDREWADWDFPPSRKLRYPRRPR